MTSLGTTVKAQRVPVKPAVFEKLRNSMATCARPLDLEDGVGNLGIADVRLVGGVVEEDGAVLVRVVDPAP